MDFLKNPHAWTSQSSAPSPSSTPGPLLPFLQPSPADGVFRGEGGETDVGKAPETSKNTELTGAPASDLSPTAPPAFWKAAPGSSPGGRALRETRREVSLWCRLETEVATAARAGPSLKIPTREMTYRPEFFSIFVVFSASIKMINNFWGVDLSSEERTKKKKKKEKNPQPPAEHLLPNLT